MKEFVGALVSTPLFQPDAQMLNINKLSTFWYFSMSWKIASHDHKLLFVAGDCSREGYNEKMPQAREGLHKNEDWTLIWSQTSVHHSTFS